MLQRIKQDEPNKMESITVSVRNNERTTSPPRPA